jgi:flagellin
MDINSINNNINPLNNSGNIHLEKSASNEAVDSVDKGSSLALSINEYNKRRDELSLDVQNLNSGIAASQISQNGLNKQQEIVSNIKNQLQEAFDSEVEATNFVELRQEVNSQLKEFNEISYETKFNNQNLLNVEYYDEENSIDISTVDDNFSIERPNTPEFANEIFETINGVDLSDKPVLENALNRVEETSNKIQNIVDNFTEFGNRLESAAVETLNEQQNLYAQNVQKQQVNFGKESNDFSSSNVQINSGYLVASQANIVQEQSVRLLS